MDIQTAFLTLGVCIGSAAIVYFISIVGTQEKSYEQAIEEQKKRKQNEHLQKSSLEKPKKEKKFKKWSRRSKDKNDSLETEYENDHREIHSDPTSDRTSQSAVDSNYCEPQEIESKPLKPKKKGRPLTVSKLTVSQRENDANNSANMLEANTFSEYTNEETVQLQNEKVESASLIKQESIQSAPTLQNESTSNQKTKSLNSKQDEATASFMENDSPGGAATVATSTPTKKKKKDHSERGLELMEITGEKLVNMLKKTDLSDEESQVLIDVLLNKQRGAAEWIKKKDPMLSLKKQLQEKEQTLEMEQKHTQSLNAKLRELRVELTQEIKKTNLVEQSLKTKLSQQQLETQSLENRLKHIQEQHMVEKSALQATIQQVQSNVNDEHKKAISHLQEENAHLQQALAKLELEDKSNVEMEISRLQQELEQLHSTKDQYESRLVIMQQHQDELHQQIAHLENHVAESRANHNEQQNSLQKQTSEANDKIDCMEECIASLKNDLKNSHSVCEIFKSENTAFQERHNEVEKQLQEKDEEIKRLRIDYEDVNKHASDLQCQVSEWNQKYIDQTMQLRNLQQENSKLVDQLASSSQKVEDGHELPHQNGEFIEGEVQKKTGSLTLHEKMLEEAQEKINQLKEEVNKQKLEIVSLTEEIESQKKKNNELREKNWKAMEAVSVAEKVAEEKVKQILNGEKENLKMHLTESEKKSHDLRERLLAAENRLKEVEKNTEERICHIQRESEEKQNRIKKFSEERLQEMNDTSNKKLEEVQKLAMVLKEDIENVHNNTRHTLQRIFPNIKLMSNLSHNEWLNQFEEKAMNELSASVKPVNSDSSRELKELAIKLAEAEKQKDQLDAQVKHYQTVLFKTESILNKLQSSVESEEQVWKERLQTKEQELQNVLKEKESLEVSLQRLNGLEEMQMSLRDLQVKLQDEKMEKKQLEQKFDEASKNVINLRDQIESKQQQLEELLKEKISADAVKKELDDVKIQLEKEKKIIKDLSSQTVKLHSLVKTGQDALKAEQETVKQLKLELAKGNTENGSPIGSTCNQENENISHKQ